MKPVHDIIQESSEAETLQGAAYGPPKGEELPQVAGLEDILMDVYSDILNMPREYAAGHFHHQYVDDFESAERIIH